MDVDAAVRLAGAWRAAAVRIDDVVHRACVLGDGLDLGPGAVQVCGRQMADELRTGADLLDARAAAMAAIDWAGHGSANGWVRPPDGAVDELVEWLGTGSRGSLVTDLAEPDAATWTVMVGGGSTTEGGRTRRFVDIAAEPGAGVIVVDVFIPERNSLIVQGDRRGHADPVFGELTDDDSRMIIVADLAAGRASIQLDDTCLAGGWICNEARPIETGGAGVVWAPSREWGGDLEIPNQVSLRSRPGRLEIDYDIVNGIVPAPSVDGTITVTTDGTGGARVDVFDRDRYPSIGVYHYGVGHTVEVLARQDSRGVVHAVPWLPAVGTATAAAAEVLAGGLDVAELLEQRRRRIDE